MKIHDRDVEVIWMPQRNGNGNGTTKSLLRLKSNPQAPVEIPEWYLTQSNSSVEFRKRIHRRSNGYLKLDES